MAAAKSTKKVEGGIEGEAIADGPGRLFELPLELFNEIMIYLDRPDLSKLSSCCRASRNLLSRDVFGHLSESLTLTGKSDPFKAFPGVNSLRHLQSYFSYVVLKPPLSFDLANPTSPLHLEKIYTYVETIKLFPYIDRLWICWELPSNCPDSAADAYRNALVPGILSRLVTYEFWPRLNLFGLERYRSVSGSEFRSKEQISISWHFGGIRAFSTNPEKGDPMRYITASCEEHENCSCAAPGLQTTYMELKRFGFGEAAAVSKRWGLGNDDVLLLNTLDVHTDEFVGTELEDEGGDWNGSETESEKNTSDSDNSEYSSSGDEEEEIIRSATPTVETQINSIPEMVYKGGLVYPFVKKLVMSVKMGVTRENIAELAYRCPNVSHLRIDGELKTEWTIENGGYNYQQDEIIYSELMNLESLETAVLPWPSIGGGAGSERMNTDWRQAEESIVRLAEGGLGKLRYVSLVHNSKKWPSSHWTRTYGVQWEGGRCSVGVTYFSKDK